jgi:hypothetical protein
MKPIKLFKLVNGEEVIGEVVEDNAFKKVIAKPRVVMEIFTDRGPALTFRPFMRGATDVPVIHLPAGHIIHSAEPTKTVEDAYIKDTSPIIIAKDA